MGEAPRDSRNRASTARRGPAENPRSGTTGNRCRIMPREFAAGPEAQPPPIARPNITHREEAESPGDLWSDLLPTGIRA